jgi:hypothetical protein
MTTTQLEIQTAVTGLPPDEDTAEDDGSFGFGVPTAPTITSRQAAEVSFASDPTMNIAGLKIELEKGMEEDSGGFEDTNHDPFDLLRNRVRDTIAYLQASDDHKDTSMDAGKLDVPQPMTGSRHKTREELRMEYQRIIAAINEEFEKRGGHSHIMEELFYCLDEERASMMQQAQVSQQQTNTDPHRIDPPARTVDGRGMIRGGNRRWRPSRVPNTQVKKMLATPGQGDEDPNDEDSSSSDSLPKAPPGQFEKQLGRDFPGSNGWDHDSFLYHLLVSHLQMPESFMDILQGRMKISTMESFLEFFKDAPSIFLERIPILLEELYGYHDQWYICSMLANFFVFKWFPGEGIESYAGHLDHRLEMPAEVRQQILHGLTDHLATYGESAQRDFREQFGATVSRLRGVAARVNTFKTFNARIGRDIPSTPPAPAPASSYEYQGSPIRYPVSKRNPFSSLLPAARQSLQREPWPVPPDHAVAFESPYPPIQISSRSAIPQSAVAPFTAPQRHGGPSYDPSDPGSGGNQGGGFRRP